MSHLSSISEGARHVHRSWQLLLMPLLMSFLNLAALVVFVVVPLVIALVVAGFDASELAGIEDLMNKATHPLDFVLDYLGVVLVLAAGVLVYSLVALSLWIFVLGGSAGVLGKSVQGPYGGFDMKLFFAEGRRLFSPLAWYTTLAGLAFVGLAVVLLALAVLGGATVKLLGLEGAGLGLFFKVFIILSFSAAAVVLAGGSFVVAVQGLAPLVLKGSGAAKSIGEAVDYLGRTPGALCRMGALTALYFGVQAVLLIAGYPLQLIPVVGFILYLPYQLFSTVAQGYVCLVLLATIFVDYAKTTGQAASLPQGGPSEATAGNSMRDSGTLSQGAL